MVRFFAALFIIFSVYQMSHSWFVKSHEKKMKAQAERFVKASMPGADVNSEEYKNAVKVRLQRLLDSTSQTKITWFGETYKSAKDQEAKLGLDLQGGMSVTLEVGMADLLRSLSGQSTDKNFNAALEKAIEEKATSGKDLIDLFIANYSSLSNGAKLSGIFAGPSKGKVTISSSDNQVIEYIRKEADDAFASTANILRNRIDRFGVASPTINSDKAKKVITVELAGTNEKERVRAYLQSSANLQFFELYNIQEIDASLKSAQEAYAAVHKGTDTTKLTVDPADTSKVDTAAMIANFAKENPIVSKFAQIYQPEQDPKTGKVFFPAAIGAVMTTDTAELSALLKDPIIASRFPANLKFSYGSFGSEAQNQVVNLYALKTVDGSKAKLEGEHIEEASQDFDERGKVAIKMQMDPIGSKIWAKMTGDNIGKGIAIVLDDFVQTAPNVNSVIPNGSSEITGSYTVKEATDMAEMLKSGKLPAPAKIVQEQVVGPTLGEEAVNGGMLAFTIAFAVIFVLMLVYYNSGGWIANVSLILNILFTIAILTALGNTFTAASIAGLVLTIGMAVDTNVLIFERIKEELSHGKSYKEAVNIGYRRSLAPVLDAHITTFITAAILYYFGLGPVKGFAFVQMWGIALNLFCGILISRTMTDWFTDRGKHLEYFTAVSRKIFKHAQFKFIEGRKKAYIVSGVLIALGIASFFNGFDYGVEFKGGRSYTVKFDQAVKNEDVANALHGVFGEHPIIKTVGDQKHLNITTAYKIDEPGMKIDSLVERTLYTGLSSFLPNGLSFEKFDADYKIAQQTVQPSISEDLKRGAIYATGLAILAIVVYIFARFRDSRFSIGTIISLIHDVLVTLAVFSFCRGFMPFPLEIDQHFIAAILTVVGFSMNDTVIVFDRIRENLGLMKGASKESIINRSINDTLSRTIMTSFTVFISILILFIVGGEVTRGFAFAMLIGVLVGTYSSIFVAAPILVDFQKDKPLADHRSEEKKEKTEEFA